MSKKIIVILVITVIVIIGATVYFFVSKKSSSQDLTYSKNNNLDLSDSDAVNARVNNNFIDAGIAVTFAIPSNWKADSENVFTLKNFDEEYSKLEGYTSGGHMPWRLDPREAAGACLSEFRVNNGSDRISFPEKLIEVKKNEIYALEIGTRKFSVYLKTKNIIPVAYKLEIGVIGINGVKSSQGVKETAESAGAEEALVDFFDYLKHKEYNIAVTLLDIPEKAIQECPLDANEFDGCIPDSWEGLESFSPREERNNKAKVLENYAGLTKEATLKANVVEVKKYSEGKYILTVQFLNSDGSILVEGPCCGATEEQMPSSNKFEYKVKKIDGIFKVITAPLFRP